MKITITTPKQIAAFLESQYTAHNADPVYDRARSHEALEFSIKFKPIDNKIWQCEDWRCEDEDSERMLITDASGDDIAQPFLFAIVKGKAITVKPNYASTADGNIRVFNVQMRDGRSLDVSSKHVESITYTKQKPSRIITDPVPAPLPMIPGLQYQLEPLNTDGVRGFKAGCNRVTGDNAVRVLKWLAETLGYTVKAKPQGK